MDGHALHCSGERILCQTAVAYAVRVAQIDRVTDGGYGDDSATDNL